ncbi:armadillo-like helical domain-containing protein 4 [Microtus oregoni]|uniref:armadillo-like helical domain-containing protein 4 n=1 Tax=Microtus oregoni TaxID=111838 RepID=UPI001BB18DA8|nr:armadillo-like helical domain-containing protein 4 [Microtus oregoni]
MSRPTLLPSSVPFCSVLFLTLATQCLAFPKVEKREMAHAYAQTEQSWKMETGEEENISSAPEHMSQQTSFEAPMVLSVGPSVMPLNKVFSVNKEHHRPGAGLLNPNIPDLQSSTEPAVSAASEQGHGPSQLEGKSSEQRLPKALSIIAVSSPASLNPHQEGPQSSSSTQPIVEGITVVTRDFLKYVDNQLFATESQEAVSLGHTPSSYINTKEMLAASPRTEKADADAAKRTTAFPGVDSTADTEHDGERPSEESDDNVQTTATTYLETTPKDALNIDPSTESLLGDLKVTVSVSTAVPVSSVPSDEWDDTKFESVSQARTTDSGDHAEIRVRTEPPHGAQESFEGTEGSPTYITQEMTMATQEPDPTLALVTQEHVEVPRGSGKLEEGMPSPSPVSADVGATELSRRWESLATPASTAVVPLTLKVTSSMEETGFHVAHSNFQLLELLKFLPSSPKCSFQAAFNTTQNFMSMDGTELCAYHLTPIINQENLTDLPTGQSD